jgi:uncharacterized protein
MKFFLIPVITWFIAFLLKIIIDKVKRRQHFMNYGGWPSTHTALVAALATVLALEFGLTSPYFATALILAMIVIIDALGLRRIVGSQSQVINQNHATKLPEQVGHNVLEVISGLFIAVIFTVLLYQLI